MTSLDTKLQAMGLSAETTAAIMADLADSDVRSLLQELLLGGFWREVVDENVTPGPTWIHDWRRLAASGFPMINGAALDRLVAAGVDPHDLTDVVRSAQILTVYNIANLLDWPSEALDTGEPTDAAEVSLELNCTGPGGHQAPIHELHSALMERDPAGRHGEARSLQLRQWQMLAEDVRDSLGRLIHARQFSAAAVLWRKQLGGELAACLAAVQGLRDQLPRPRAHES